MVVCSRQRYESGSEGVTGQQVWNSKDCLIVILLRCLFIHGFVECRCCRECDIKLILQCRRRNNSKVLKDSTEEDRRGYKTEAQIEDVPKECYKRETGSRYKKMVTIEDKPE
jgi:hypothetical protein